MNFSGPEKKHEKLVLSFRFIKTKKKLVCMHIFHRKLGRRKIIVHIRFFPRFTVDYLKRSIGPFSSLTGSIFTGLSGGSILRGGLDEPAADSFEGCVKSVC